MSKKTTKKGDQVRVQFLCHNASGKYLLPYNHGAVTELDEKQAKELIAAGDAREFSKEIEAKEAKEAEAEAEEEKTPAADKE